MRYRHPLFIKICVALVLFLGIQRFCHKQTRGFSLLKIASHSPIAVEEEIPSRTLERKTELETILNQSFSFLNSGGQCYAFMSEDGKTVIKFFKQHHIRMWKWLNGISLPRVFHPFLKKILEKKQHQSPQFFESCKIAYEDFKERSGLIYLHLNKTDSFEKKLKIIDKLGIVHFIDLDNTDFALQWRAEMPHPQIKRWINEYKIDTAKECIDSIIALILERWHKGIVDRDPNIRRNIGLLGTHAIEIDLGSFSKEVKNQNFCCPKQELIARTRKFHTWLLKQNAELAQYLVEQWEKCPE